MSENEWRNTDAYRAVIQAYRRERQMGDEYGAEDAGVSAYLRINPHVTEREARVTVREMVNYALVNAPAWFWGNSSSGKDLVVGRVRRGDT
ncbi:hypothetical protein [Zavarzinia sp. CC-PAN008]|uniref:hypothetical protein n=1 Tax=Zavarzinia sp. CC-PAN008 TaxID=3243332 RepID=UPI003F74669C